MKAIIIIGAAWALVSVIYLWINYRFYRSYLLNKDEECVFEIPVEMGRSNKSAVGSVV